MYMQYMIINIKQTGVRQLKNHTVNFRQSIKNMSLNH